VLGGEDASGQTQSPRLRIRLGGVGSGSVQAMIDQPIRFGIVGSGCMGLEHIGNINALDGACVAALVDPHLPSLEAGIEAADGSVAVFDSPADLARSGSVDAVVIATPDNAHIHTLRDLLGTGLHLLVEKPLCTTVEDCREVATAAQSRDALLWVGLEYRYMAPVARLVEEVRSGTVGEVRMLAIREHRFPFLAKVDDWNRFSRNTGGTLVEKCCHFFDLMNLVVDDKPERVMASGGQSVNHLDEVYDGERSDILDNAFVIVDYSGGARAMLDLCMFAEATHNQEEMSVVGELGKVEAFVPDDLVRIGLRCEHSIGNVHSVKTANEVPHLGGHHGSSFVELQRFAQAIRRGARAEVSALDGLRSVAMGVAAHRSIDEGRPVLISEVTEPADWHP